MEQSRKAKQTFRMMACAIVAAGLTLTAEPVMAETELQEVTQQQGITGTVVDA